MTNKNIRILRDVAIASVGGLCLFVLSGCESQAEKLEKLEKQHEQEHEQELRRQAKRQVMLMEGRTGVKYSEEEQYQYLKRMEQMGYK